MGLSTVVVANGIVQVGLLGLFLTSLISLPRRRGGIYAHTALMLGALTGAVLASGLAGVWPALRPWGALVSTGLLVAQPYLLLRIAMYFRPAVKPLRWPAMGGLLVCWVIILVLHRDMARPWALVLAAYFLAVEAYAGMALRPGGIRVRGIVRRRLAAITSGTGWLLAAFTLVSLHIVVTLPRPYSVVNLFVPLMLLLAAAYYRIGFTPPAWMRRRWGLPELYDFLRRSLAQRDQVGVAGRLMDATQAVTGALAVAVAIQRGHDGVLDLRWKTDRPPDAPLPETLAPPEEGLLGGAWRSGRSGLLPTVSAASDVEERLMTAVGASGLLVVAIDGANGRQGLLLCFGDPRQPFIEDDIELVQWLAEQAGVVVDNARLYRESEERGEALERASRAKSEFLAGMSHELRTPLNAILGFSELLLDDPEAFDAATRHEYLQHIHSSGRHLLGLINDVLDLSKVEAGRTEVQPQHVDATETIAAAVETVEPLAAQKDIAIQVVADGAGTVWADPAKFKQVLYNLLSNAIKFTPAGGQITASATRRGDVVEITIRDTGIGISVEDRERIFEEFVQVSVPGGARQGGTGLGLTLSKRFVELHGGQIWVDSASEGGSSFHFTLPIAASVESAGRDASAPLPTAPLDGAAAGPLVLVVEDDARASHLLCRALQQGGYRTEVAADGNDAVLKAKSMHPAAITLDVILPGLDGWEVLRRLKAEPATRSIPVVIISVVDDRPLGYALGATDYFLKPVRRDVLIERLSRYTFTTKVKHRTVTMLVVDDDPQALTLATGILGREGFQVLQAADGPTALHLAEEHAPDLILLDLVMPGMNGFEVLKRLKEDQATADIPVLILTAATLSAQEKHFLNGQVLAVLEKGTAGGLEIVACVNDIVQRLGYRSDDQNGRG